jgi:excisionase family DNA binding protein
MRMIAIAMTQEKIYTANEAATILRVHPRTIHRMIKAGELEAFTIRGREYRIRQSALEEVMRKKGKSQNA